METTSKSLWKAVRAEPTDLDLRLVLADKLEDEGDSAGANLSRLLVEFSRFVLVKRQTVLSLVTDRQFRVGLNVGNVWTRIYTEDKWRDREWGQKSVYAWVENSTLGVYRGSWRAKNGPIRFFLHERDLWKAHVGPYGLAYLTGKLYRVGNV